MLGDQADTTETASVRSNRRTRGVNVANAFDAADGRGIHLTPPLFAAIRSAGFTTLRLPIHWSAHADVAAPYAIDEELHRRVDDALNLAEQYDLDVIIDVHHYRELMDSPRAHQDRFLALWRQIAQRYAARPLSLSFELLNEPTRAMDAPRWNELLQRAWATVRESNPSREVIIGPADMNNLHALTELKLPGDPHVTATIHYYAPMAFTHQGATWIDRHSYPIGRSWGTAEEIQAVRDDLRLAHAWSQAAGVQVLVGEFGTHDRAHLADRVNWTTTVRSELDRLGLDWCYWDLATDFGIFDLTENTWRQPLRAALLQ